MRARESPFESYKSKRSLIPAGGEWKIQLKSTPSQHAVCYPHVPLLITILITSHRNSCGRKCSILKNRTKIITLTRSIWTLVRLVRSSNPTFLLKFKVVEVFITGPQQYGKKAKDLITVSRLVSNN